MISPGIEKLIVSPYLSDTWVALYRINNPKSRATRPYVISRNGGIRREYKSLVNGSTISMDARWRIPTRVYNWMQRQEELAAEEVQKKYRHKH